MTYSQVSKMTCCSRSGNFCTMVTTPPVVRLTPYIGAVVLNDVLQRRDGVDDGQLAAVSLSASVPVSAVGAAVVPSALDVDPVVAGVVSAAGSVSF